MSRLFVGRVTCRDLEHYGGPPTVGALTTAQDRKNLVVALYAVLSTDARDLATVRTARDVVLATLRTVM